MSFERQVAFWLATFLVIIVLLWLLSDILLPFVAGMVIAYLLDPLADKAMIVSIYVALGIVEAIPRWLVILVVSRDIMIVSAVILSWLIDRPVKLKPITVSKLNTVAQIVYATVVLAALTFGWEIALVKDMLMGVVAALTLLSVAFYLAEWVHHMNATD